VDKKTKKKYCGECDLGIERQLDPVTGLFFHDIGGQPRQYPICANQDRGEVE
jgi:hypothetical protein